MNLYLPCIYLMFWLLNPIPKSNKGYIVAWNNDTTLVQVILPKYSLGIASYNLNNKVEIIDSTATIRTYYSRDIKAFGYQDNSNMIIYRLKPIEHGSDLFLEGTVIGNRANLFEFEKQGSEKIYFTLEKANSIYIFLDSDQKPQVIRDRLKTYLEDSPEIDELIDRKFSKPKYTQVDLREVVRRFNQ